VRVLVIGVGGLGCPALLALGEAGVHAITIIDPDRVEATNLHRQILYREADIGQPKVARARAELARRYPRMAITALRETFSARHAELLAAHELVLDGTDRFETKLAIADACVDAGVPFVFAGVVGTEGQVLGVLPGRSACPRCLFDEAPPPGAAPSCSELGILGPIAGLVAAEQVATGLSLSSSAPRINRLWTYDGLRDRERSIPLARAADCRGCGARRHLRGALVESLDAVSADAPVLDLSGLVCPATFVETRRALERMPEGARLWVHLTSDEAQRSVPASLAAAGHRVLARVSDGETHRLLLERAAREGIET